MLNKAQYLAWLTRSPGSLIAERMEGKAEGKGRDWEGRGWREWVKHFVILKEMVWGCGSLDRRAFDRQLKNVLKV